MDVPRVSLWKDPIKARKVSIIYQFSLMFLGATILVIFCVLTYLNGYTHANNQNACFVWLLGLIIMRLFTPPPMIWCNPAKETALFTTLDKYVDLYKFVNACWVIFGSVMAIISATNLIDPDKDTWLWIYTICAYIVDGITCWTMACCMFSNTEPNTTNDIPYQTVLDVENPNLNKHNFYNTCVVCLEQFTEKDEVVELKCRHIFHPACIGRWILKQKNCPTCKEAV